MAGYLPPVVINVVGNDSDFVSTLARDKALLADFAKQTARAQLGAEAGEFESDLNAAKVQLLDFAKQVSNAKLGADASKFWADIAALRTELAAMSPLDIRVDANVAAALAKIEALRGGLALSQVGAMIPALGGGGGGGNGGFLAGLLAGRGSDGGGGGGASFLSMLGWGNGLGGMAGFGSILGFAGLGAEHAAMTGVGLAGSAAGGLLGGAALGLGSLGVMGVGMGTDMAGIGQAANDIRSVTQAQNALSQAVAVYGKNSTQAATATAQLKFALDGFSSTAQAAVLSAANTGQQFHQMFNAATGAAEAAGAQIIQEAMQVGEKFLPTIGQYAAQNMGIIKSGLQPLFTWLQGPEGMGVFQTLEAVFQSNLPTAMHAFDQGVQLVGKTLEYLAPQTGGLLRSINNLVTRFNGADFSTWVGGIQKLIGDFREWEGLIKILVADIYQLFHHDAGTAGSIVTSLTTMLQKLHDYETSASGGAAIHNVFETHKQEVQQLLDLLPSLLGVFGKIEVTVAPQMTSLMTDLLKFVNALLKIPAIGPLLAWVGAFALLGSKLKLIQIGSSLFNGFKSLSDTVGPMAAKILGIGTAAEEASVGEDVAAGSTTLLNMALTALTGVGVMALVVGIYELYTHFGLLRTAMILGGAAVLGLAAAMWVLDGVPIVALVVLIVGAIVGLIAVIYELVTHWKEVWDTIKQVAADAWSFLKSGWGWLIALFMPPIGALVALIAHWQEVWDAIKTAAATVWDWLKTAASDTWNALKTAAVAVWDALKTAWSDTWNAIQTAASAVWSGIESGATAVWHFLTGIWHSIDSDAQTIWNALVTFISGIPAAILAALSGLGNDLSNLATTAWNDFKNGVTTITGDVISFVKGIPGKILSALGNLGNLLFSAGKAVIQGFINGITSMGGAVAGAVGSVLSHIPGVGAVEGVLKHLAVGGIVTGPTAALIGEAGPEAVIPLNNPARIREILGIPNGSVSGSVPSGLGYLGGGGGSSFTPVYNITVQAPTGNAGDITRALQTALAAHDQQLLQQLRSGTSW